MQMLLPALAALLAVASASNYCELCNDHTMCLHKGTASTCLRGDHSAGSTQEHILTIVSEHNALRNRVASGREIRGNPGPQPPAANMQDLTWDMELAEIAQRWADQCTYSHDACRKVDRFYVGQNIAETSVSPCSAASRNPEWKNVIKNWYDEVDSMDNSIVASYSSRGPVVGHYTQIVWATTSKIGCGFRFYEGYGDWCHSYYVCNYGKGGNILGQPVYQEGQLQIGEGGSAANEEGQRPAYDEGKGHTGKGEEKYYDYEDKPVNQEDEYYYTFTDASDIYGGEMDDDIVNIKYAGDMYDENGPDSSLFEDDNDKEVSIDIGDELQPTRINEKKDELPTDKITGELPMSQGGNVHELNTEMTPSHDEGNAKKEAEPPVRTCNQASSYNAQLSLLIAVAPIIVFYYL